jgi:hypothetical protein
MPDELIDLTKVKPTETFGRFDKTDFIILLTTGGVGYLAKEGFKYFFPGVPSVTDQLRALAELVEACGRARAASLKVRVSTDAKLAWQMPEAVKGAKVLNETTGSVDLEIVFRSPRNRKPASNKTSG